LLYFQQRHDPLTLALFLDRALHAVLSHIRYRIFHVYFSRSNPEVRLITRTRTREGQSSSLSNSVESPGDIHSHRLLVRRVIHSRRLRENGHSHARRSGDGDCG
jgi:hypothetical protein